MQSQRRNGQKRKQSCTFAELRKEVQEKKKSQKSKQKQRSSRGVGVKNTEKVLENRDQTSIENAKK